MGRIFGQDAARHCKYCDVNTFASLVHISLRYRYWFTETPGAGCDGIKLILQRAELEDPDYQPPGNIRGVHARMRSPLLGPQHVGEYQRWLERDDIQRFCWTRDPYTRFLSAYLRRVRPPGPLRRRIIRELEALDRRPKPGAAPDFEDFLLAVEHEKIFAMDPAWKPQYCLTLREMIDYHFIGRFEHFERDLREVTGRLGFDFDRYCRGIERDQARDHEEPDRYWTETLRKRVARLYEADFDYFGYSARC